MKKIFVVFIVIEAIVAIGILAGVIWVAVNWNKKGAPAVSNFQECVSAGNPVMESYPRQCKFQDKTFVEEIGNGIEKTDLIRVDYPRPNQAVKSPLVVTGQARGYWYFEASFPVVLTNWDGVIIAQGIAQAKSDWMTENFVPFSATLNFTVDKNAPSNKGFLILKRDNPSGLPANDDALEIPVLLDAGGQILPLKSGVMGQVLLGPTCPVQRIPPDPSCADKPYQTTIQVTENNSPKSSPFAIAQTDKNGNFTIDLPTGDYSLQVVGGAVLPRCTPQSIIVKSGTFEKVNISCDTGIR